MPGGNPSDNLCSRYMVVFSHVLNCCSWEAWRSFFPIGSLGNGKLSPFIGQVEHPPPSRKPPLIQSWEDLDVFPALYTLDCQLCLHVPLVCMWLYEDKPSAASIWALGGYWMSLLVTEWLRHWPHLCPWLPFSLPSTESTHPRLLIFKHCLQDGSWTWSVS